jgi:hypothetical protein
MTSGKICRALGRNPSIPALLCLSVSAISRMSGEITRHPQIGLGLTLKRVKDRDTQILHSLPDN